jgi:spore coat polysaccharide biosynthesis predicted glycosyltransferase SpsG
LQEGFHIVAHCRANRTIGLGHAVRLGALLDHFPADVGLTGCVDRDAAEAHFPRRMRYEAPSLDGVIRAVATLRENDAFVVLFADLRAFDLAFWSLADERTLTVAICDRGGDDVRADIVINPSDHQGAAVYGLAPALQLVWRGARYIPLRRAFEGGGHIPGDRNGVGFVIGSGERSERWARSIVETMTGIAGMPVRLVVSRTFKDIDELKRAAAAKGFEIQTGLSANEMRDFYLGVDICVMTGGTAIYEAMALGCPILCYPILEDMVEEVACLERVGALVSLSPEDVSPDRLARVITAAVADKKKLGDLARSALVLVDGQGCERIVLGVKRVAEACLGGQAKADALRAAV